jgi:hypothetical protein
VREEVVIEEVVAADEQQNAGNGQAGHNHAPIAKATADQCSAGNSQISRVAQSDRYRPILYVFDGFHIRRLAADYDLLAMGQGHVSRSRDCLGCRNDRPAGKDASQ